MNRVIQLVIFTLDQQHYALPLCMVRRVVRAVEITPLPKAPDIILGVINLQGHIVPVVDMRQRFTLPARPIELSDRLIIAQTSSRSLALVVDSVTGLAEITEQEVIAVQDILTDTAYIKGIVKLKEELVLIHDLSEFLSLEEAQALDQVMSKSN